MESEAKRKSPLIDVRKSWQRVWWATVLGVPEGALLDAIDQVGNEAAAVEASPSIRRARERHRGWLEAPPTEDRRARG
jgi:hypothetical protein